METKEEGGKMQGGCDGGASGRDRSLSASAFFGFSDDSAVQNGKIKDPVEPLMSFSKTISVKDLAK